MAFLNTKDKAKVNLKNCQRERGKRNPTCYIQKNGNQLIISHN